VVEIAPNLHFAYKRKRPLVHDPLRDAKDDNATRKLSRRNAMCLDAGRKAAEIRRDWCAV
jgi:hypothetical protein